MPALAFGIHCSVVKERPRTRQRSAVPERHTAVLRRSVTPRLVPELFGAAIAAPGAKGHVTRATAPRQLGLAFFSGFLADQGGHEWVQTIRAHFRRPIWISAPRQAATRRCSSGPGTSPSTRTAPS